MNLKHGPSQTAAALHQGQAPMKPIAQLHRAAAFYYNNLHSLPPARSGHAWILLGELQPSFALDSFMQFSANRAFVFSSCFLHPKFINSRFARANLQLMRGSVSGWRDQRLLGGRHKDKEATPPEPGALWEKTSGRRGTNASKQPPPPRTHSF